MDTTVPGAALVRAVEGLGEFPEGDVVARKRSNKVWAATEMIKRPARETRHTYHLGGVSTIVQRDDHGQ